MIRIVYKTFFLILMAFSLVVVTNTVLAQVYKIVDEDGNVMYTDRPPKDGSKPVKLAPISVIEAPTYGQPAKAAKEDAESVNVEQISLKYLRKNYADFAIVTPQQEESVWNPDKAMAVAWNTRYELQEGMQVTIYIDGMQYSKTTDQIIPVSKLDRGEHKIEAQLTDARNRKIATAEPVTFYIRRPNLYSNPQRRRPRG